MAIFMNFLASAAMLYLASAAAEPDLCSDCGLAGSGGADSTNACAGGKDCNQLIAEAISTLLDDTGSNNPDPPVDVCGQALEAATAQCEICGGCDGFDRLYALPEALPWAATGPSAAVAAAVAASLAAAVAGAAVMWRGRRAALASARSALVAEGHQDEDAPMVEGSSAAASAP